MSDDVFIWFGLFLFASSPFIVPLVVRWRFPRVRFRMICHVFSAALLGFLAVGYIWALRECRLAGNQDDGSSGMAALLLIAGCAVVIPENLILYLPFLSRMKKEAEQGG